MSSNAPQNVGVCVGQADEKPAPIRLIGGGLLYPLTPEQRKASAALAQYLADRGAKQSTNKDVKKC